MNRGLVAGYVVYPDGKPAVHAYVTLRSVTGGTSGSFAIQGSTDTHPETYTDAYGRFNMPFLWSGTEFAEGISSTVVAAKFRLVAYAEKNIAGGTAGVASGRTEINSFLYKDIRGLLQSTGPLLSNTDLSYYAPYLKSYIGKYLSGKFWNTAMLTTESWLLLGAGVIEISTTGPSPAHEFESDTEMEYDLLPEFEVAGFQSSNYLPQTSSRTQTSSCQGNCGCSNQGSSAESLQGDISKGWERDNESFTVHTANYHLSNFYRVNDRVQKVYNCCIDPDFFFRKCEFITAGNVKGAVVWWPNNKKAGITVCVNGQKKLCWYDYRVDPKGNLLLINRTCSNPFPC